MKIKHLQLELPCLPSIASELVISGSKELSPLVRSLYFVLINDGKEQEKGERGTTTSACVGDGVRRAVLGLVISI